MIRRSALQKDIYRPKEIADMLGVHVTTIQRYMYSGELVADHTISQHRRVHREDLVEFLKQRDLLLDDINDTKYDVIYTRVSTHKQKSRGDLQRQRDTLVHYVVDKNPRNLKYISDVGSGLNDNRKGLMELLDLILSGQVNRVFVTYRDRLTRFGFNYLSKIAKANNTEIIVMSSHETDKSLEEELAQDIVAVIHSFSGKLYGLRRKVKEEVLKELDVDG